MMISIFCLDLLKDDVDKDKKRAATQAAFKKKFKKNSDFWVYEKKIRLVIRKAIKQQWFYWTVIVLGKLWTLLSKCNKTKSVIHCNGQLEMLCKIFYAHDDFLIFCSKIVFSISQYILCCYRTLRATNLAFRLPT